MCLRHTEAQRSNCLIPLRAITAPARSLVRLWDYRYAAPSEHDDSVEAGKSEAIHGREFILRDPCRTEPPLAVHAAMVVSGIAPTRGGSERVRAAGAFPACGVGVRGPVVPQATYTQSALQVASKLLLQAALTEYRHLEAVRR